MKRILFCFLFLVMSVSYAGTDTVSANLLSFDSMYGVDGPFVNNTTIRGVLGDELPWSLKSAHGYLTKTGHLYIKVRGLVFADDPSVPVELRGINDEVKFRGLVSCLSEEGHDIKVVNRLTRGFAATRSGNSIIDTHVMLPASCVAPIIFVMSGSENKWFSVTGGESLN